MKYILLLLLMIPGITLINADAQPSDTADKVRAGVIDKSLDMNDVVVDEPATDVVVEPGTEPSPEPLVETKEVLHPICDKDCVTSEPKQLENKSVKELPKVIPPTPIAAPVKKAPCEASTKTSKTERKKKHHKKSKK